VCHYGEPGSLFFVILKGKVGVKVPTDTRVELDNYLEIYKYIREHD